MLEMEQIEITIGSSLKALKHAYQYNTKIILNKVNFPHILEPQYTKHAWSLLYTKLMLSGQTIGGDTVKAVKITNEEIIVVCENNIVNRAEYGLLFVCDDKNVIGLPPPEEEVDKYKVIDCLKSAYCGIKNTNSIYTKSKLTSELHILKKRTRDPVKFYSISYLKKKDLVDFNYSDTMVKFKCEELLMKNGHKGRFYHDRPNTSPIVLETTERELIKEMDKYNDTEKIKFIYGN
jgi:sulfur carrier protein ThiS